MKNIDIRSKVLLITMSKFLVQFMEVANKIPEEDYKVIVLTAQKMVTSKKGVRDNLERGNLFMMGFFLREIIECALHDDNPPKKGSFYFQTTISFTNSGNTLKKYTPIRTANNRNNITINCRINRSLRELLNLLIFSRILSRAFKRLSRAVSVSFIYSFSFGSRKTVSVCCNNFTSMHVTVTLNYRATSDIPSTSIF